MTFGNHEHVSFSIELDYELCVDISIYAISYRIWLNLYKIYYIEITKMEMEIVVQNKRKY